MSAKVQKIEDVKLPLVGKFYLVPCVERHPKQTIRIDFLPVIGDWHEDKDIGTPQYHYHYDVRFFPDWLMDRWVRGPHGDASVLGRIHNFRDDERTKHTPFPITYRRLKMKREMPIFPNASNIQGPLQKHFKDHKLKCHVCPHRGFSLDGLPVAPDGTVVCNGHGLKWSLLTGTLVPR
jgi:hypothetical protein